MSKKITQFNTSAGTLDFITVEEFIVKLFSKEIEKIKSIIVESELLDQPPADFGNAAQRVVLPSYGSGNMFAGYREGDDFDDSPLTVEVVALPALKDERDIVAFLKRSLLTSVNFFNKEFKKPKNAEELDEIAQEISIRALENFGNPEHFIACGSGVYIVAPVEDLCCEIAVCNGIIHAGILPLKRTIFGVRTIP